MANMCTTFTDRKVCIALPWTDSLFGRAILATCKPAPVLENPPNLPGKWVLWRQVDNLLDQPADASCSNTSDTQVDCTVGPVAGGESITVTISGQGNQVGDVVADVTSKRFTVAFLDNSKISRP